MAAACAPGLTQTGSDITDPVIPRLTTSTGWWIDTTGRVSPETLAALNAEAEAINQMGFQLGGAIFLDSVSDGIQIATEFGNVNGLGSAEKDNGIAIVLFLDKEGLDGNAPAIDVAIGSGLEGLLNDAKVGRFLDEKFVPARTDGDWETGLVAFVQHLRAYLDNPEASEFQDPPIGWSWLWILLLLLVLFILLAALGGTSGYYGGGLSGGGGSLGGGGGFSGGGGSR